MSEMHLGSLKSFDWDVIAHEYGHAVACLQSATRAEGGFHDGSNPYDIEKNPSGEALNTCRNKELSNALALNEAYAAWFALNFWKERRYSSEIAWLGGTGLIRPAKRIRWAIRWIWKATQNLYGARRCLAFRPAPLPWRQARHGASGRVLAASCCGKPSRRLRQRAGSLALCLPWL